MLYYFLTPLRELFFGFNVFRYITFRAVGAGVTAFAISLLIGPSVIRYLSGLGARQTIERVGFDALYEASAGKEKTPTMGGLLILAALVGSTLLWADLRNQYVLLCIGGALWLGVVGFVDDYLKIAKKNSKGLRPLYKFGAQLLWGAAVGMLLYLESSRWSDVSIPFMKNWVLVTGPLYVAFVMLVITGASNAVNLTDGLDGLAAGCTLMIALAYGLFSYIAGHSAFSHYLQVPFIPGAGELTVVCAALFGAGMGFLWFNCHPASLFMGDVGSLSLGGVLGSIAVFTKKEFVLVIVGGIFVMEALSVILQVASYKLSKKRIFLMAPIHHHFQLRGNKETKVVIRFWIVSIILSLLGVATLKLQ